MPQRELHSPQLQLLYEERPRRQPWLSCSINHTLKRARFQRHASCSAIDMPFIGSYRDLDVWMLSMDLVDDVLRQVKALPRDEFELKRQIKSAAISIPSNVAEGWCRKHRRQAYQNHVSIAMGSSGELDTELEVCFRNKLLGREDCQQTTALLARVRPMLGRLHDSLDG